jgi:UDP-N-acetylmuramate dehydrogenase
MINIDELAKFGKVETNISFKKLTTIKAGGLACYVFYPSSIENLVFAINYLKDNKINYFILGNGSNVLASDEDFEDIVICTKSLNECETYNNEIVAQCGVMLSKVCYEALNNNLTGFEFAINIPGTIGGALLLNASCFNQSISDHLVYVIALTKEGKVIRLRKEEMLFLYRSSTLKEKGYIVLLACFELTKTERSLVHNRMLENIKTRKLTQPVNAATCGPVFISPIYVNAWELVKQVKVDEEAFNGAKISEIHANYIVNFNSATSKDIKSLIDYIRKRVYYINGIDLELEVILVNWRL